LPSIHEDDIIGKKIVNIVLEPYYSKRSLIEVISIHDSQLIHSSWPNVSGELRQVFVIRYMLSTSEYQKNTHLALGRNSDEGYDSRDLFLVRGKNLNFNVNESLPLLDLW